MSDDVLPRRRRSGLFAKYAGGMIAVVSLVLVVNGAIDVWFSYQNAHAYAGLHQKVGTRTQELARSVEELALRIIIPPSVLLSADEVIE